jgi:hypothetical protein
MDSRLIFRPRLVTFDDGVTQKDREATGWKWWLTSESRIPQANPWGHSTVRLGTWPYGRQVSDFTLSGKTSKRKDFTVQFRVCDFLIVVAILNETGKFVDFPIQRRGCKSLTAIAARG